MAYNPAGNQTNTASLRHLQSVWYNKKALDQLKVQFKFEQATEPDVLPRRSGKTVQWFRYTLMAAKTTPHAEGTVGTSNSLDTTTVQATVSEYADFITISTLLEETAIDPIVQNAAEQLGYSAGLTVDTIIRTEFDSNIANVTQSTIGSYLAVNDLRKAKLLLEGQNVQPREGGDFLCIMHPYNLYDIIADSTVNGFIDIMKYAGTDKLLNGEAGRISGVRIVTTTNVGNDGVAAPNTKYYVYVVGKGAVGAVDLAGSGPSKVSNPNNQSFKINVIKGGPQLADPEGVIGSAVSYRFVFVAKTLDSTVYRYKIIPADSSII